MSLFANRHRAPRRRKRNPASANLTDRYREPFASVGGESIALNVNPNRGKRHLSTLGHKDPRETNGRAKPVAEKTVTRHHAIKPRAHKSVAWLAADLHLTSDAVRYACHRPD